jgi:hypothetical protein
MSEEAFGCIDSEEKVSERRAICARGKKSGGAGGYTRCAKRSPQ